MVFHQLHQQQVFPFLEVVELQVTAEQVRIALAETSPMKDSTARTILRRLGEKGFVTHAVEGRTYVYSPTVQRSKIAAGAVEGIIEKFCSGSVEELLLGLVDSQVLSPAKLKQLVDKISRANKKSKRGVEERKR